MAVISRPLRRNIATTVAQPEAPAAVSPVTRASAPMKHLAMTHFVATRTSNAAKRDGDKARKELLKLMLDGNVQNFEHRFIEADTTETIITATVATPEGSEVDVAKLFKVMGADKDPKQLKLFLEMVSATKKAVTDALGTAMVERCSNPTVGTVNVTVAVKK